MNDLMMHFSARLRELCLARMAWYPLRTVVLSAGAAPAHGNREADARRLLTVYACYMR